MPGLIQLPSEILHHIVSYTDRKECKELGLTCSLLRDISKEWFFRSATLSPYKWDRFEELLANRHLSQFVTKVYVDISDWNASAFDGYEGRYDENDENDKIFFPERFSELFDRLKEFSKLQSVVLRYSEEYYNDMSCWKETTQDFYFRSNVMKQLMPSISSLPRLPRELAICDMQNVNETDPKTVAMITKVLEGLQSLRLNITNEHVEGDGELDIEMDEPHIFLNELPSFWLKPPALNLQHLTLYNTIYFGFYPKLDLRGVHFPQLKTLSLGNHTFVHDSQLHWILSHSATLTELYLDDCPILFEIVIYDKEGSYLSPDKFRPHPEFEATYYASYETRWHDYFRAFKDGLPLLQRFRYGNSPYWWNVDATPFERETEIQIRMTDESYLAFCDGIGPSSSLQDLLDMFKEEDDIGWVAGEPLLPSEEDKRALEELCDKIGQPL